MNDAPRPKRRPDLDALRIGAIYLLILFHVAKVYDPRPIFHIWSPDLIPYLNEFTGAMRLWRMPLLFMLAGWAAVLSFHSRGKWAFMVERIRRLALPLFFGSVFLCTIIKYLELRNGVSMNIDGWHATAALQEAHGVLQTYPVPVIEPYTESFFKFLPRFFTSLKFYSWSHLWFLAYLLVITSITTPLLARVAKAEPRPAPHSVLWLLMPGLLLLVSESILRPHWPGSQALINDWANVARYSLYFGMGVVWARYGDLGEQMRVRWSLAFAAAILIYAAHKLLGEVAVGMLTPLSPGARVIEYGLPAVAAWLFILSLIGAAARFITRPSFKLTALAGTVLPVYIVHQPVIVILAFFLDPLPLPVGVRFMLVLLVSLAATLAIVLGPVQRFDLLRAGFGLKAPVKASWHAAGLAAACVAAVLAGSVF
jgi:surface polysaccharide O-acyltransferase-like enzyme